MTFFQLNLAFSWSLLAYLALVAVVVAFRRVILAVLQIPLLRLQGKLPSVRMPFVTMYSLLRESGYEKLRSQLASAQAKSNKKIDVFDAGKFLPPIVVVLFFFSIFVNLYYYFFQESTLMAHVRVLASCRAAH